MVPVSEGPRKAIKLLVAAQKRVEFKENKDGGISLMPMDSEVFF